jgi:hypothetical protein
MLLDESDHKSQSPDMVYSTPIDKVTRYNTLNEIQHAR